MSNPDMPTTGWTLKWGFILAVVTGLFIIVPTTMALGLQPAWMGFQRETMKQSHQYVEAKASMLLQWTAKYNELETEALKYEASGHTEIAEGLRRQQESLLARIRTEAARVPEGALPADVTHFLQHAERSNR